MTENHLTLVAEFVEESGVEGYEILDYLQETLESTDYTFIDFVFGNVYLAKYEDDGNVEIVGHFEEEDGDVFGDLDEVATNFEQKDYRVVSLFDGTRRLAYVGD